MAFILIIRPDHTYAIVSGLEEMVTELEVISTPHGLIWHDEGPVNRMATYLWWKLCPEMQSVEHLSGTCYISGLWDEDLQLASVSEDVVDLYQRLDAKRMKAPCA